MRRARRAAVSLDRRRYLPGTCQSRGPARVELGRLLQLTERIFRDEETDEDLQLIFAPGTSLGGARPKASVIDQHGHLSVAKFPKETDEYSIETLEEIAPRLAGQTRSETMSGLHERAIPPDVFRRRALAPATSTSDRSRIHLVRRDGSGLADNHPRS